MYRTYQQNSKVGLPENPNYTPPEYSQSQLPPIIFWDNNGNVYSYGTQQPTFNTPVTYELPTSYQPPVIIPINPNGNTNNGDEAPHVCDCVAGTPYILPNGSCGCTEPVINTQNGQPVKQPPVIVDVKTGGGSGVRYYTLPVKQSAPANNAIIDKLKENPVLAIGGLLAIGYLLLKK